MKYGFVCTGICGGAKSWQETVPGEWYFRRAVILFPVIMTSLTVKIPWERAETFVIEEMVCGLPKFRGIAISKWSPSPIGRFTWPPDDWLMLPRKCFFDIHFRISNPTILQSSRADSKQSLNFIMISSSIFLINTYWSYLRSSSSLSWYDFWTLGCCSSRWTRSALFPLIPGSFCVLLSAIS